MPPRVKIPDDAGFRALWMGDKTLAEIAEHYGVGHHSSVSKAAKRFGLPPRSPGNGALGAGKVVQAAAPEPEADAARAAEREADAARAAEREADAAEREADAARAAEREAAEVQRAEGLVQRLTVRGIAPEVAAQLALGLVRARAYADLDAVADRHAIPLQRLLPLWHEVRA